MSAIDVSAGIEVHGDATCRKCGAPVVRCTEARDEIWGTDGHASATRNGRLIFACQAFLDGLVHRRTR